MKAFTTIQELKTKLQKKEISSKEVTDFYSARLEKFAPELNCLVEKFSNPENISKSTPENKTNTNELLDNIPCVIKDNICQKDRITSAGSKILSNYTAPYDATVIERIKNSGAVILGRSNQDEFGMGGSGEFSAYGPTKNPWDKTLVPGGSSSGSAAAVAAGLVPFALGTETGGSIRGPASFCNLVGMYPTYGLHSRFGVIAFASSNDQVGALTQTVYDNALVATALSGHDPKDSTSLNIPVQDYTKNLDGKLPENMTIGVIKDALTSEGINPEVRTAFDRTIKHLETMGAKIKIIDLPTLQYSIAVYFIISRAEAASNLSRYDGSLYGARAKDTHNLVDMYIKTREEGFGVEVKRRILVGNYVLSAGHRDAYYNKASHVRAMIRAEFENAFKEVDLLISPTTPTLPFKIGEFSNDPVAMYMADYFMANCVIGTPAISIPCGFSSSGLPIGFQFFGPRLSEALLYKAAYAFEQSTDYHLKHPKNYE